MFLTAREILRENPKRKFYQFASPPVAAADEFRRDLLLCIIALERHFQIVFSLNTRAVLKFSVKVMIAISTEVQVALAVFYCYFLILFVNTNLYSGITNARARYQR